MAATIRLDWIELGRDWTWEMTNELRKLGHNTLVVDWTKGAAGPNYFQAVANTRSMGAIIARFISPFPFSREEPDVGGKDRERDVGAAGRGPGAGDAGGLQLGRPHRGLRGRPHPRTPPHLRCAQVVLGTAVL